MTLVAADYGRCRIPTRTDAEPIKNSSITEIGLTDVGGGYLALCHYLSSQVDHGDFISNRLKPNATW